MTMEQGRRLVALERRFDALEAARIQDRDTAWSAVRWLTSELQRTQERLADQPEGVHT